MNNSRNEKREELPETAPPFQRSSNAHSRFIGWRLEEVHAALSATGTDAAATVITETAAATRPGSSQIFGAWRVLRCRESPEGTLELTVARELLKEERRFS